MTTASSSPFSTTDLNLAAFLKCRGYVLHDVERDPGGRCTFVLDDRPTRSHDVASYFDESGTVPALRFAEALRLLKARVYGGSRG